MKTSSFSLGRFALQGTVFGISAATMIILVSLVYAAASWGSLPTVNSGSGLTATAWNDLVAHVNQSVKQASPVITVSGSNVGIGNTNPGAKLDVAGDIKATAGGTIGVTKINGTLGSTSTNIPSGVWTYIGDSITLTPGNWIVYYNGFYDHDGTPFTSTTYNHPALSINTTQGGIFLHGNLNVSSTSYSPFQQTYEVNVTNTATYYIIHNIQYHNGSYVRIRGSQFGNFYALKVN